MRVGGEAGQVAVSVRERQTVLRGEVDSMHHEQSVIPPLVPRHVILWLHPYPDHTTGPPHMLVLCLFSVPGLACTQMSLLRGTKRSKISSNLSPSRCVSQRTDYLTSCRFLVTTWRRLAPTKTRTRRHIQTHAHTRTRPRRQITRTCTHAHNISLGFSDAAFVFILPFCVHYQVDEQTYRLTCPARDLVQSIVDGLPPSVHLLQAVGVTRRCRCGRSVAAASWDCA